MGFDTETVIRDRIHEFYSFQAYSEEGFKNKVIEQGYHTNEKKLEGLFTKETKNAYFVCFNLAFDGIVVSRVLKDKGYSVKAVLAGSRVIRLTIRRGSLKWIFCDLRNILSIASLEKVGEMLKFLKLEKPSYLGHRGPETFEEKVYFRKYAMRDAEICYKAAKMVYSEFKTWRTTCAGLAIRVFKRDFCRVRKFRSYEPEINDKLRLAYHGGRTECFIRGVNDVPIKQYDINSLYPYVMRYKAYPNVIKKYSHKYDVNLDYEGIAHVVLSCEHDFPPICIKKLFPDSTEKLIFPSGIYKGWFTYPELRAVEDYGLGKILEVAETFEWKETFNPFEKYVDHFYKLKEDATAQDSPKKNLYKIMLNGTYGKFGEHGGVRFLEFDGSEIINEAVSLGKEAWYHSVPLAAYITAYARLENWQYLRTLKPKTLYYTDTDCFATSGDLDAYCGSGLGKLKVEAEAKKGDACFIRAKFYMLNDAIKLKGFHVEDTPTQLRLAIWNNNFSRQEHRILKAIEAKRLKMLPLTDCYITKSFSVDDDGKRKYDVKLSPQDLLFSQSSSKALVLR